MNIDTDIEVFDTVPAYSIEVGDQIVVESDHIEVSHIAETDDLDEVIVSGYSHDSGDRVEYSLFADDMFDVWTV